MAYEQSSAAGMHDLLDKLRLFLIADGWAVNDYSADSQMYRTWSGLDATGSYRLHVQKILGPIGDTETCYFNFRSATRLVLFEDNYDYTSQINGRYRSEMRGIGINGSSAYSGGGYWDQQTGAPEAGATGKSIGACMTELPTGTIPYWFFSNGDTVVVVAEILTDTFSFMAFGRLTGKGSYSGGPFYAASSGSYCPSYQYWYNSGGNYEMVRTQFLADLNGTYGGSMAVRFIADGVTDWRHQGKEGSSSAGRTDYLRLAGLGPYSNPAQIQGRSVAVQFITRAPNTFNAIAPMCPAYVFSKLDTGRYSYLGYPEGIRIINRTQYNPGDSFILGDTGGEEWVVFPAHQIGPVPNYPSCDLWNEIGFAFRKNT